MPSSLRRTTLLVIAAVVVDLRSHKAEGTAATNPFAAWRVWRSFARSVPCWQAKANPGAVLTDQDAVSELVPDLAAFAAVTAAASVTCYRT